jgi:serine phosphatase RsbU (regulator of sigma subunit)
MIILLFFSQTLSVWGQNKKIPEDVQIQIDNFKNNAIKNRNVGNDNAAATYLNKIAYLYWEYFVYADAVKYFEEVLTINQDIGNTNGEQKVLDNLAFVYSDMGRYDKSIECFTKSLVIIKNKKDNKLTAECLSNLALAYNSNGQYNEAIKIATQGLDLSKALNSMKLMRSFYGSLYESYEKKGSDQQAKEFFELYSSIDKHIQQQLFQEREIQNKNKISQITAEKVQKEQELVKTQDTLKQSLLEVELLNAENEAKEARIKAEEEKLKAKEASLKAERRLRYFFIVLFVFGFAFTLLIYKQMRNKKKANAKLQELYSEIEKKNHQILDSINYASHIQEAILPYERNMLNDFPNSFVFYKPRDIVSGDFYWHTKHENKVFIAAIDCTGHGVPGAFMSMIGNTLLNEIVNEQHIHNPALVLTELNEKVMFTLNQGNGQEGFSEDGMDITFCCYNADTHALDIALANHNACLIQGNTTKIIEGDIFSIGGNVGIQGISYTNHSMHLTDMTTLYMFSDGYQDQFGGAKGQKYMAPRFINFLESLQQKPFVQHRQMIENEYLAWKGNSRQIDDVLVIGVRFLG